LVTVSTTIEVLRATSLTLTLTLTLIGGPEGYETSKFDEEERKANWTLNQSEKKRLYNLFKITDRDRTGYIEVAEVAMIHGGDQAGFFLKLDVNGDGLVAVHEWIKFFESLKISEGPGTFEPFLLYFERNAAALRLQDIRESDITPDPAVGQDLSMDHHGRLLALFQNIDSGNHDYRLDKTELAAVLHGGDVDGWMARLDENQDGFITEPEWLGFFTRLLQTKGEKTVDFLIRHWEP